MKKEANKEVHSKPNSFGVAAVTLGIFSLLSTTPIYGIISGIIAIVFANKQAKIQKNGWSKAGNITGILGIILNILAWIFLYLISQNPEMLAQYGNLYAQ